MLNCNNVVKRYGGKTAVDGATLRIEAGRLVALLGANGSGKTTLMKMIAGLVKPTGGEILFENMPIGVRSKARIAYMPTEGFFYPYMTARDAGKYYKDFFADFDIQRYENMLAQDKLDLNQRIRAMSSGMTAKLKLALTFSRNSRLVMLDEPLNGIDILARERVLQIIEENRGAERSMMVSSHLVNELEHMIDDAIFMKDGRIVMAGSVKELREQQGMGIVELYRKIYGSEGDENA